MQIYKGVFHQQNMSAVELSVFFAMRALHRAQAQCILNMPMDTLGLDAFGGGGGASFGAGLVCCRGRK